MRWPLASWLTSMRRIRLRRTTSALTAKRGDMRATMPRFVGMAAEFELVRAAEHLRRGLAPSASCRSVPRSWAERCICAMPEARPLVHTFVARKTRCRTPSSATKSPVTASARLYIGDESIMRPPASTSASTTLRNCGRAGSPAPTLNTYQGPIPTTGIASPLAGIARAIIVSAAIALLPPPSADTAAAVQAPIMTSRRRIRIAI
jgi:hypothetical protein